MLTERVLLVGIVCFTILALCIIGTVSNHLKDKKQDQEGGQK